MAGTASQEIEHVASAMRPVCKPHLVVQLNGQRFYAAGSNGYALALESDGKQYGFTDAALDLYFAEQYAWYAAQHAPRPWRLFAHCYESRFAQEEFIYMLPAMENQWILTPINGLKGHVGQKPV